MVAGEPLVETVTSDTEGEGIMTASGSKAFHAAAWLVVGSVLAIAVSPIRADIYNGDFEADPSLDDWASSVSNPPGSYVEAIVDPQTLSTVARLHAKATYTYEGDKWIGDLESAFIQQLVTLDEGDRHLQFDGRAVLGGLEVLDPTVTVIAVTGGGGGGSVVSDQWADYTFPLLDPLGDPLPPGTTAFVIVQIGANPPATAGEEGQQIAQVVDLYVDNFDPVPYSDGFDMPFHEFVLGQLEAGVRGTDLAGAIKMYKEAQSAATAGAPLPEPATLSLLCLGGLALVRRRR